MTLTIVISIIAIAYAEEYNDYQILSSVKLPKPLMHHISEVYNNTIYLFGGNPDDGFVNYQWWTMDLLQWDLTLNTNNVGVISSVNSTWKEIYPNMPDYWAYLNVDGEFICHTQCTALVDNWLFVIPNEWPYQPKYLYKIDLSQDPPKFGDRTAFNSSLLANNDIGTDLCVTTDGKDVYYMGGWASDGTSDTRKDIQTGFYKYDVAGDFYVPLPHLSKGRHKAACTFNLEKSQLYLFGGLVPPTYSNSASIYEKSVDWYNVSSKRWSNNTGITQQISHDISRGGIGFYCMQNPFEPVIECIGGREDGDYYYDHVDIFNTVGNIVIKNLTNALPQTVAYYSFISYMIDNTSVLYLVLGGYNGRQPSGYIKPESDIIQYVVRYELGSSDQPTVFPTKPTTTITPDSTSPSDSSYDISFKRKLILVYCLLSSLLLFMQSLG